MDRDTEIGGGEARFPATRASIIKGVCSGDPRCREQAWELLIAAYWKPIYKHIRMKWNASNEQAKDWTQEFFARAMEGGFVKRFDAQKAGFRTYLRVCADGFVANERKSAGRAKRGGHQRFVSLDFVGAEAECLESQPSVEILDSSFDRECARSLLEHAIQDFRAQCNNAERLTHYSLFERYDLHSAKDGRRPTYEQLAAEFDLPVSQVTNYLAWSRRVFRQCVLHALRKLTVDDAEFRDEARRILGWTP